MRAGKRQIWQSLRARREGAGAGWVPYLCKAEKRLLGLSSSGPRGSTVPRSLTQCR